MRDDSPTGPSGSTEPSGAGGSTRARPAPGFPAGVRLRSGLSCTWPAPGTVQLGLSRRFGVVVAGLAEDEVRLIERLRRGGPPAAPVRGHRLLRMLSDAGVLSRGPTTRQLPPRLVPDAAVWSIVHACPDDGAALVTARRDRSVVVLGAGRLGGALAATLAAAGVGRVGVVDPFRMTPGDLGPVAAAPGWLGRWRRDAAAERAREAGADVTTTERLALSLDDPPDLVVLIEPAVADATAADELLSADVAHLSVVVREAEVIVGPLVVPGSGPCLRCLDMHRSDRDAGWSSTLRQLLAARADERAGEESASAVLAAGLAALQVLAHLDGAVPPAAVGATLEVELPQGLTARRSWPVHPRCGCNLAF